MTAVQWLAQQLQAGKELSTVLSQANKLFEQQINDAVEWGNRKGYDEHRLTCILDEDEDYYNETYKKD
jgi:glutathionylspermidine synthase